MLKVEFVQFFVQFSKRGTQVHSQWHEDIQSYFTTEKNFFMTSKRFGKPGKSLVKYWVYLANRIRKAILKSKVKTFLFNFQKEALYPSPCSMTWRNSILCVLGSLKRASSNIEYLANRIRNWMTSHTM